MGTHKITISLPGELLSYADAQAHHLRTSRSQFISQLLAESYASAIERLGAEGYCFYAAESETFAEASVPAVTETLADER